MSTPLQPGQVKPINALQSQNVRRQTAESWGDKLDGYGQECMIFYGEWRAGKTNGYLDVIQTAHMLDDRTRAFVINTDKSLRRNIEEFPYLDSQGIVHVKEVKTIEDLFINTSTLVGSGFLKPTDWIVIDLASWVWEKIPDFYARTILGKTQDEIETEYAKDGNFKGSAMLAYYKSGINPMWYRWDEALRESGAHVILVSGEKALTEDAIPGVKKADKNETIRAFQSIGTVPMLQRSCPFSYHTIIHFSQPYTKKFYVQTAGEKGKRAWIKRTCLNEPGKEISFGDLYLRDIAGWEEK